MTGASLALGRFLLLATGLMIRAGGRLGVTSVSLGCVFSIKVPSPLRTLGAGRTHIHLILRQAALPFAYEGLTGGKSGHTGSLPRCTDRISTSPMNQVVILGLVPRQLGTPCLTST